MRTNRLSSLSQRQATGFMDAKKESFEEREKAVNALVHEIRNPLTAIKLTNQFMQEAFDQEKCDKLLMQSYMFIIANNIERIERNLKEVLTYKSTEVEFEPVNVCECIDKAVDEAKDRLYLSGITLSNIYTESHWVYGNKEKLIIAFLNIIINSVEAIKTENGKIWISIYKTNNIIRVTFKDNGTGMEPSTVEKIFDIDFSTKDGIGIGLFNVKEIMKLHKANILADSLPGVGTSVSILFNCIPEDEPPNRNR